MIMPISIKFYIIVWVIKWLGHIARMQEGANASKFLTGKRIGKGKGQALMGGQYSNLS